ncbi:AAA family ATPase [Geodermatophilus sp. YIM 151500]|uniref:helix-turn-helix transcriptional regulator n=1 Tax=Geodermatophilus sp. YIM 151500 TaxID=2984531 RepID=UPI0021E45D3A|nr:AAA family ATPase [Geodermatophilus sp. YIM 151500]MCV2489548.1 AAA family ATPase [Geodermatophilus sp. YIM 151500]
MPRRTAGFIGRSEQLDALLAALGRAAAGSPALVAVTGEAGLGKSRLLDRFAGRAAALGATVVRSWCVPVAGAGVPFGALAGLVRDAVVRRPEVSAFVAAHAAEAAHLLPVGSGREHAPPLTGELAQLRLFEAVRAVFTELTASGPVVAVVEDVHWGDRSSGEALAHLVGPDQPAGLLVVLSYRREDLSPRHPLHPVLRELLRGPCVDRLDLAPFDRRELAAQVTALLGEEPTAGVLDELAERSGGNPFFVEELVAARLRGDGREVPQSLTDVLTATLDRLPPEGRRLLRFAAAAGRVVDPRLLDAGLGLGAEEVAELVRAARDAGLVATAGDRLAFRHELTREAVYATLLPSERVAVHAAVATALEARPTLSPSGRVAGELAHHWALGGQPRRALAAAARAMREARELSALTECAQHAERALALWDAVPDAGRLVGMDRVELLLQLAEDSVLGGGTPASVWAARALGSIDPARTPARHAVVTARLARYELLAGDPERALATAARATAEIAGSEDTAARTAVAIEHAQVLMNCDLSPASFRHAREALDLAERSGDAAAASRAGFVLGTELCAVGDWRTGLEVLDRAYRTGSALPPAAGGEAAARAAHGLAFCLLMNGFPGRALRLAAAQAAAADRQGFERSLAVQLRSTAAVAATVLGELTTAEGLLADMPRPALRRFAQGRAEALSALRVAAGDLPAARAAAADAAALGAGRAPIWLYVTADAEVALAAGEAAAARDSLVETLRVALEHTTTWPVPRLTALTAAAETAIAEDARAAGDQAGERAARDRAEEAIATGARAAADVRDRSGASPPDAVVWTAVGRAWLTRCGRPEPDAWAGAAAAADGAGMVLVAAGARIEQARDSLAVGSRAAAAHVLGTALSTARRCGAHGLRRAAEQLAARARLGRPELEDGGPTTGARLGLTDRELQVLRLVADGRTNREVGTALFMSPKTASVHVTSLLRKLDVPDRRAAARVGRRLGLV